jgi:hypothetical protein
MRVLRDAPVALWFAAGIPNRIELDGEIYVVSDMPTPLEDAFFGLTHVPDLTGWRFQGTREDGTSRMFDVRAVAGGWRAMRVYD